MNGKRQPLNVICVNANNYLNRGDVYVEALLRGVKRNLSMPFEFHVLGGHENVLGWWNKLFLFEPGRFKGRCLFFDLDTIICGPLDNIASYDGDFAGISDFYAPSMLQSGVMAWEAGKADYIFTEWEKRGKPQFHPAGDGGWIHEMAPHADRLQNLYPGQIFSFKAHCRHGVPNGASVICFHGEPRPHAMGDVMRHWLN